MRVVAVPSEATRHRASRWHAPALAVAAGVTLATSVVPVLAPPFAFLFWLPLRRALDVGEASARRGFVLGTLAGASCNAVALSWVVGTLEAFGGFPTVAAVPTAALLFCAQGMTFGVATAIGEALRARGAGRAPLPLTLALFFAIMPALFPWRPATSLVAWLPLAQLAELGGPPLLDLVLLVAGAAFAEAALHRHWAPALLAAASLAIAGGLGSLRLDAVGAARATAPTLRVGVVQPNFPVAHAESPERLEAHLATLRDATAHLEARGAELVIWPETAYPYGLERGAKRAPSGARAFGARGPLLAGALTDGGRCARWNSVVSVAPGGAVRGVSDKVELIPFGETVPLWSWLPPLRERFPCPGLRAAEAPVVLPAAGARVGILNCYEDVLPAHARRVAEGGPDFLVNVTNDAWFGPTAEPHLHDAVARLRAIETRRDLVRATNSGVSSLVAATGARLVATETFVRTTRLMDVRRLDGATRWVATGDATSPVLTLGLLWVAWSRRRRA